MEKEVRAVIYLILEGILCGFLVWCQVYWWNDRLRDYGMFLLLILGVMAAGMLLAATSVMRVKVEYVAILGGIATAILFIYNVVVSL